MLVLSISILFVSTALVMYAWNFWSAHSRRGRAVQILYWIEQFICGHGHVTGMKWISSTEFEVPLRLTSNVFRSASMRVNIAGWRLPWRKEVDGPTSETMTFCADLDYTPAFNADLKNMRWFARSRKNNDLSAPGWNFETVAPVVLTTRLNWEREITSAFQAMMQVENKEDLEVVFRKTSPHFSVTLPLEKITPGAESPVFEMLNAIAMVDTEAS